MRALTAVALMLGVPNEPASAGEADLRVSIGGRTGRVAAKDGIHLVADARWTGPDAQLEYRWSSMAGPAVPDGVPTSKRELSIPPKALVPGGRYLLRVQVTARWVERGGNAGLRVRERRASMEAAVVVNVPPRGGGCRLSVEWLDRTRAQLVAEAPGWTDDDAIAYRFTLFRNGRAVVVSPWRDDAAFEARLKVRVGDDLRARCTVRDEPGDERHSESRPIERPIASLARPPRARVGL
jgi:hypothetical protein